MSIPTKEFLDKIKGYKWIARPKIIDIESVEIKEHPKLPPYENRD